MRTFLLALDIFWTICSLTSFLYAVFLAGHEHWPEGTWFMVLALLLKPDWRK